MSNDAPSISLPLNWKAFLTELDEKLPGRVELHCLGGFVATVHYGCPRTTADIDFVLQAGWDYEALNRLAGEGSALWKKHGLHLEHVGIACFPEDYDERLTEMFPGEFLNLVLMAFDPYDVILAKLPANRPPDREDAAFLAKTLNLKVEVLRERYYRELRVNLIGRVESHDLTLQHWIEEYFHR